MARTINTLGSKDNEYSTSHYIGPDLQTDPIPKKIGPALNMQNSRPTIGFKNHPDYLKEADRGTDFEWGVKLLDNGMVEVIKSQTKVTAHPSQMFVDGRISPFYEADDLHFETWRDGAVKSPEQITKPNKEGYFVETHEFIPDFPSDSTQLNKPITEWAYLGPKNKVGKYISIAENFKQDISNIMFDDSGNYTSDASDFSSFLTQKYGTPKTNIEAIGTEYNKDAIASILLGRDASLLFNTTDYSKKLDSYMKAYGLTGKEAINTGKMMAVYHEIAHHFQQRNLGTNKAEIDVGETLRDYFLKKAESSDGEEARTYKILARIQQDYIDSFKGKIKKLLTSNYSRLEKLVEEGKNKGLTKEEAREYAANKLEEELSEKSSSKESRLESLVKQSKGRKSREYNKEERRDYEANNDSDKEAAATEEAQEAAAEE